MRILKLVLFAGFLAVYGSPSSATADLLWGINGHPFTAYPDIPYRKQIMLLKDLGVRSYRVNISSVTQAELLAKLVAEAKPHGIDILPVITPSFDLATESPEQLYESSYRTAVALVSQFKEDIRVWELGNELENFAIIQPCEMRDDGVQYNCDWGPAGGVGPLEYYGPRWAKVSAVLKGLSDGTIAVDPTIRKAIGTAGWGHLGAFERMQNDGILWDISVWHMYGQDPEWAFKTIAKYNRPIWVTEFNHPFGSQRGEVQQAHGLTKQMRRLQELRKTYNVEAAHIYELLDETYWAPDFEAFMGLLRLEKGDNGRWEVGEPKPAYQAVKRLIAGHTVDAPTAASHEPDSRSPRDRINCDPAHLATANRPPSSTGLIEYAYCLVLDRPPDGAGLEGWRASIDTGRSTEDLIVALLASDEFADKHAVPRLSNSGFVDLLYNVLLDREPDGAGLTTYTGQLDSQTAGRFDVARSIIASDEFRSKFPFIFEPAAAPHLWAKQACEVPATGVQPRPPTPEIQASYVHCLAYGHAPDDKLVAKSTEDLKRGNSPLQLLTSLLKSDDFARQHATARLSNTDFVTLLYALLLGRRPDGAGLASYVARLDKGELSRPALVDALIASDEFRSKQALLFSGSAQRNAAPTQPR